jgi:hypothetical protein
MPVVPVYNPNTYGLSVSALNLWLVNRVAFELSYFHNFEPVEPWNKNTGYGSLIGAGIEGWIKTRELRGVSRFIETQYRQELAKFNEFEELSWWAQLAEHQTRVFVSRYEKDFDKYDIHEAEDKHKVVIDLPSSRQITLAGRMDGVGKNILFEHKAKADWNTEKVASEIDLDLQYNFYLLLYLATYDRLPSRVWYQHSRRAGGFAYNGPRKKSTESKSDYLERVKDDITEYPDNYFYQFISIPERARFDRFLHICLYPILESFLDWYEYMTHPQRKDIVNKNHWLTPYGLYNPYVEGTDERFRTYALTGSTLGLKRKTIHGSNSLKKKTN